MKHNTVMSILDHKHGVDRAVVIVDPALIDGGRGQANAGVVGKFLSTHIGQTDWATLWDWTDDEPSVAVHPGLWTPYQTASGKWCSDRELIEGMSFGRHGAFKPGEWLTDLEADGYLVIEVV